MKYANDHREHDQDFLGEIDGTIAREDLDALFRGVDQYRHRQHPQQANRGRHEALPCNRPER
jgi:hypothetical protein